MKVIVEDDRIKIIDDRIKVGRENDKVIIEIPIDVFYNLSDIVCMYNQLRSMGYDFSKIKQLNIKDIDIEFEVKNENIKTKISMKRKFLDTFIKLQPYTISTWLIIYLIFNFFIVPLSPLTIIISFIAAELSTVLVTYKKVSEEYY